MTPLMQLAVKLNATEAQVKFALLAGRFNDYRPVLGGAVLTILRKMERRVFDTEGAAIGEKWAPLAPSTIRQRLAQGFAAGPILQRTRRLVRSLTAGRKTPDSVVEIDPFGMTFGTTVDYAPFHQTGPRRRQFLPDQVPQVELSQIRTAVRDYLVEGRVSGRAA